MSKYTDMLTDKYRCYCGTCEVQKGNVSEEECKICSHYTIREALQIADRLEQAESELKDEYNSINNWYMNKYDLNVEHTELETDALHFTGMIMQTIGYLLDTLADIRGDNNGN